MTRLLIFRNGEAWGIEQKFTDTCKTYGLPYHSIKSDPWPRRWYDKEKNILWEVRKMPYKVGNSE